MGVLRGQPPGKAFMDCLVIISACPQEWNPATNYHPSDLVAKILVAG